MSFKSLQLKGHINFVYSFGVMFLQITVLAAKEQKIATGLKAQEATGLKAQEDQKAKTREKKNRKRESLWGLK